MLRTLFKSLREYKKESSVAVSLAVLEVIFEIIIPLCMADIIDLGIEKGAMNTVMHYGFWLFVLAVLELIAGFAAAKTAARASAGFAANLRQDIYDNVQTFSFSSLDKFSASSIITRLTTDITNVQNAYQMAIRLAVRCPIMIAFSMLISFRLNVEIAGYFLLLIPLLMLCLYWLISRTKPIIARVFTVYDHLNNVVQENIKGIRVVKSFCREEYEINKFQKISGNIYGDFVKAERIIALNSPIMQFFMYGCMLMIAWIGAKAIAASGNDPAVGLTTGNLTALITYSMQILMNLMMLSMVFVMIVISRAGAERITEILNEETDIKNPPQPVMKVKNGEISFRNVSFVYRSEADKKVIAQADITIASGETVGIIGGTGSAKTSLVQLIPRLYDVSEGVLTVGGVNVKDYDLTVLRNAVAFVLQKNELFSGSVKENLRWGNPAATDDEIREACRLACADEFIARMPEQYDTYIEQGGKNVSGGQKQRLCIARALLKKPKILILDDSTSAVDTRTESLIRQSLAEYIPDTTKIIIAQRISSVQKADRIIVMESGKIEAIGTHAKLLRTCSVYREIYESQQKGEASDE